MNKLNRIRDIIVWINAWLACDMFLIWLCDPNTKGHPFLLACFIGIISYYFAEWIKESVQWLSDRFSDWFVRRYVRKMDDLTDEEKRELLKMYDEHKYNQDNDLK